MAITAAQLMVKVGADTRDAERGMKQVQQQAKGLGAGLGSIAKLAGGAVAALGGIAVAKRLFSAAKSAVVDFNASMEQSQIAWSTMLKSEDAAKRMLADLQQFAKETPFDFPELEEGSRRLLAMGFNARDVIPMMTTLGDAAAALGLGTAGVNRLGLAIGQMRAKTKVSGEEMRQLTEAGVPAWDILAQAVGKPIPEVMKLASEGKIAADVFIQAFQTFSQQNYGGMMERQSQTFSGAMSNIKDSLTQGAATAFQPLFAKLSEGAQRIAAFVSSSRFDDFVSRIRAMVSGALDFVERLSAGWQKFMGNISEVTGAAGGEVQQVWHTVVGWFAEQMPKIQEIVQTVLGAISGLWEQYGQDVLGTVQLYWGTVQGPIRTFMANVGEIINLALALLKGDWEGAWTSFKTIMVNTWAGMIEYLSGAAKTMMNIIGGIYEGLEKEDPTTGWAAKIDSWAESMTSAAEEALGVEQSVGQASDAARTWADYAATGADITEDWATAWQNLGVAAGAGLDEAAMAEQGLISVTNALGPSADSASTALDGLGDSASGAANQVSDLVAALVRVHPASIAAAQAVAGWQAQIDGVNAALQANQRRQRDMQAEIAQTQARISGLNEQLSEAQRRLQELANPRLTGMGQIDMQIQALQDHLKRVELAETLGKPLAEIVRQYPLLTAGAEAFVRKLPAGEKALQQQLRSLELMRSLQYDEKLRLLQAQAGATPAETTYEAAMAAIAATKGEISGLTGEIAVQEAKLTRQQAALARVAAEAERLNDALQGYQAGLQAAQQAQTLVNQGLELAYSWFLQDRQAMLELGGEAAAQVAIMDGKARELLSGVSAFASDTTTIASETLAGMIETFESSSAQAVIAVNLELAKIPRDIYTYHHIVRVYDGGSSGPSPTQPTPIQGRASGGPVYAGQAYIVGEEGPELFVPRLTGSIVPGGGTGRGSAGAGGIVIERLVVEGTVISERELAAAVYDELQRLRRRNSAARLS
jgi:tape measure domain-containing protein